MTVVAVAGFAPELDALAACNPARLGFLRAAWYGAGSPAGARTLVMRRGSAGAPIAAIPTVPLGPALTGARQVPGAYWPLRAVPLAADCDTLELAQALEHPAARMLGPAWRLGPARRDDPATALLADAARLAGWSVLARPAGTAFVIDCHAARAGGWPRPSTTRRLARIERRLARTGAVSWDIVRGSGWNDAVLAELGAIEAASWIATRTNGRAAKFMTPPQRARWRGVLADPVLAEMLCATILRLDGRAVAFCFDLDDGPVQYGIAGSYASDLARYEIGKLVNHRTLADAIADGQRVLDLGAGDSGYKRAMGAVAGYDLVDLMFVRHAAAARLMERVWGRPLAPGKDWAIEVPGHE
ncbi:GNAT family N-acetyltransferase [Erythrobacter sp. NE805]|uniref:GNAT family N-acetyltransferase n=1 Tax=Erythrobacter sp. NE805 TaxID=3389875 RepID=UPI00396B4857